MTYDALGRLVTRKIASPIVADPVLTANIYDEVRPGYYNIGRLTTSENTARKQTLNYSAHGLVKYKIETDSAGSHHSYVNLYFDGSVHYKAYWNDAAPAVATAVWTYDGLGRLSSIPGMITEQKYETDGQTKSIKYANNVTTTQPSARAPGVRCSKSQIFGFSFGCAKPRLTLRRKPPLAEPGLHGERGGGLADGQPVHTRPRHWPHQDDHRADHGRELDVLL
jgi:hypothetical protein